jgi:F0F1-type ATP synthase assembly protein I
MDFKLKEVLEAIGPTASLVFASWIFLSYLEQRYSAAYTRYRALINDYRENMEHAHEHRKGSVKGQIVLYKRRCEQMKLATNLGVIAAIFLLLTLITGALNAAMKDWDFLKYIGTVSALIGLVLVMGAAVLVVMENNLIQMAIDSEVADLPDVVPHVKIKSKIIRETAPTHAHA